VARFIRSALRVFADHVELHLSRGACRGNTAPMLPVPTRPQSSQSSPLRPVVR
jgi:hypothetical protein